METFARVKSLIGESALNKLKNSSVAVFGVGGVGGFTVEALVRSGVGSITVVDDDVVKESNLNRQIIATRDSLEKDKTQVIKERALSINPNVNITAIKTFYLPENADNIDLSKFDYIVDAVDTVSAKIELVVRANSLNVPIISCMGTGGKVQPEMLMVSDISKTSVCPLARVVRRELKNRGISKLKVVYSQEQFSASEENQEKRVSGRSTPPSMIFVPAVAGLMLAKEVVMDLIK